MLYGAVQCPLFATSRGSPHQFDAGLRQFELGGQPALQRVIGGAIDGLCRQAHTQSAIVPSHHFGAFGVGSDAQVDDQALMRGFAFQPQAGPSRCNGDGWRCGGARCHLVIVHQAKKSPAGAGLERRRVVAVRQFILADELRACCQSGRATRLEGSAWSSQQAWPKRASWPQGQAWQGQAFWQQLFWQLASWQRGLPF